MRSSLFLRKALLAVTLGFVALSAHAEKIRIGYWTSGVSLGFGAVLEAKDFLKQAGVDAEFVRFADVNAPTRALAGNSIDIAFGAAAAGIFSTAADGVPIRIFYASQPADAVFVVPVDSPIKSIGDLRGKKVGMSPAGSSVAAIAGAILSGNYGIKAADFSLVPGNEGRLAQFLVQKQVDAAALRSVTVDQITDLKVRRLGTFGGEWKKLTHSDAVPYIGVGAIRADLITKDPQTVARVLVAFRNALAWGNTHHAEVAQILEKSANLPAADAQIYASHWSDMNRVSFEPIDIDTLKREHQIFVADGTIKGTLPPDLFVTAPYEMSKTMK